MDKKLFGRLKESMTQMSEIIEGTREASREPTGPAKALLRAIERDPQHVIPALSPKS